MPDPLHDALLVSVELSSVVPAVLAGALEEAAAVLLLSPASVAVAGAGEAAGGVEAGGAGEAAGGVEAGGAPGGWW